MSEIKTIIAFDLYGTLLSTESIAKELAKHFGADQAASISAKWRQYQLEYTWRLNSMDTYKPFSLITRSSLQHVLTEHSKSLLDHDFDAIMHAYDSLATFPDVPAGLDDVKKNERLEAYVFSNGTIDMVKTSVYDSPGLKYHAGVFKSLISVGQVKRFKPDPKVYYYLADAVGKKKEELGDIWLVSGNPFDVVGARAVGMQAAWVDRDGKGWSDALGDLIEDESGQGLKPTIVVAGVDAAVNKIMSWVGKRS